MSALEAAAVEAEVLRLCTERAEQINRFLRAQAELDVALGALVARQASASAAPVPPPRVQAAAPGAGSDDPAVEEPGDGLTAETPPPEPQDAPAGHAELQLPPGDPDSGSGPEEDLASASPASAEPAGGPAPLFPFGPLAPEASGSPALLPDSPPLPAPVSSQPPPRPAPATSDWQALYAVQSADGPWTALLEVRTCRKVRRPDAEPGAQASFRTECETGRGLFGVGDRLSDGRRVERISAAAVHVLPDGEGRAMERVPWASSVSAAAPARPAWTVTRIGGLP